MHQSRMNIVFAADNKYFEQLAVTITSVLKNANVEDKFKFHILSNDSTKESEARILALKKIKNFELEFFKIDETEFGNCPVLVHLTIQTYFRLKMPELIKEKKVLYLDCDLIVRKSLRSLYDTDLEDYIAAVVEDMGYGKSAPNTRMRDLLKTENYFNAGVMLWNLDKAREFNLKEKCFDYIKEFPERIKFCDQDALNGVCAETVKFIEQKNNFQHSEYRKDRQKKYKEPKRNIVIIHFVAGAKPWIFKKTFKLNMEYYFYALFTPWRKTVIKRILSYYSNKCFFRVRYFIYHQFSLTKKLIKYCLK